MFGLISKKKLIKVAVENYLKNGTGKAFNADNFHYRCGVVNTLDFVCSKFGVNITKEVRKVRERREGK